MNRASEPGWIQFGPIDPTGRRSMWYRETQSSLELCGGREGDDFYTYFCRDNPRVEEFLRYCTLGAWINDLRMEACGYYECPDEGCVQE